MLIEHKTSKEIGQALGISYYTVDQRIEGAMKKLGAANRRELALRYARLKSASQGLAYEKLDIAEPVASAEMGNRVDEAVTIPPDRPDGILKPDYRVVPEMFEGPYRVYARLAAIVIAALVLLFVALAGMAVFSEASRVVKDVV